LYDATCANWWQSYASAFPSIHRTDRFIAVIVTNQLKDSGKKSKRKLADYSIM